MSTRFTSTVLQRSYIIQWHQRKIETNMMYHPIYIFGRVFLCPSDCPSQIVQQKSDLRFLFKVFYLFSQFNSIKKKLRQKLCHLPPPHAINRRHTYCFWQSCPSVHLSICINKSFVAPISKRIWDRVIKCTGIFNSTRCFATLVLFLKIRCKSGDMGHDWIKICMLQPRIGQRVSPKIFETDLWHDLHLTPWSFFPLNID